MYFCSRFDWTLTARGGAHMKLQMFGTVGRATVPAENGRHGGRPYDSTRPKFLFRFDWTLAASGGARMKLSWNSEPQNIEQEISNDEVWNRCAQSFFKNIIDRIPYFDIHYSLFDIRYSLFQSFFSDLTGRFFADGWAEH
jgi:hypothetical protein